MEAYHIPVLLEESISALEIKEDGTYIDATFGGGGHSREILEGLARGGGSSLLTAMRTPLQMPRRMRDIYWYTTISVL